jgi:NAD(P)-dependent dehydrogenase (short-subunit alcohol dehydrogenase family)
MSLIGALNFSGKKVLICGGSDGIGYGVGLQRFSRQERRSR